jgi:leucyl-tRNA synthetase
MRAHDGLENLRYNTAIAACMELLNTMREAGCGDRRVVEDMVVMLSPFAPHFAEECWERLGHSTSVFDERWPEWDEALAVEDNVEVAVQVSGKTRSRVTVARGSTQDTVLAAAMADDTTKRFVGDVTPRKVIYVADRLINIVV